MTSRDEQIEQLAAKLKDWSAEIDHLQGQIKTMGADARAELQARVTELSAQKELVAAEMQRLRAASEHAWNDILDGVQAMMRALETAFERARSRF